MALDYQQAADLMNDLQFRGRVKVACLKFADYIAGEASAVAGHVSRIQWARQTFQQPDAMAQTVTPPTVMDAAIMSDGAAVSDTALQTAVEGVVQKMF